MIIRVGDYVNSKWEEQEDDFKRWERQKDYDIEQIMVHEKYCSLQYDEDRCRLKKNFDIALIRLTKKIDFDLAVQPICLPPMSDLARFPPGSCCTAVGWGINAENQLSSILQKVSIPIHNENACNGLVGWKESIIRPSMRRRSKSSNNFIKRAQPAEIRMVCAGGGAEDTCQGDSGGPLSCPLYNEFGRQWFLQGLTSFGQPTCGSKSPSAYANVARFSRWIISNIFEFETQLNY